MKFRSFQVPHLSPFPQLIIVLESPFTMQSFIPFLFSIHNPSSNPISPAWLVSLLPIGPPFTMMISHYTAIFCRPRVSERGPNFLIYSIWLWVSISYQNPIKLLDVSEHILYGSYTHEAIIKLPQIDKGTVGNFKDLSSVDSLCYFLDWDVIIWDLSHWLRGTKNILEKPIVQIENPSSWLDLQKFQNLEQHI